MPLKRRPKLKPKRHPLNKVSRLGDLSGPHFLPTSGNAPHHILVLLLGPLHHLEQRKKTDTHRHFFRRPPLLFLPLILFFVAQKSSPLSLPLFSLCLQFCQQSLFTSDFVRQFLDERRQILREEAPLLRIFPPYNSANRSKGVRHHVKTSSRLAAKLQKRHKYISLI